MKRIWFFWLLIVCFMAGNFCPVRAESSQWKPIHRFQTNHVGIAGFLNEGFGIIAGDHHHGIEITSDGGGNWTQKIVTRVNLWGIDILDEKTFFCSGNQKVLVTEDGGATWHFLGEIGDYEPDDCRFIRFLDRQTGWIATTELLARTIDGGKTWSSMKIPKSVNEIVAVDCWDKDKGFLLDAGGTLYKTDDAGESWSAMKLSWKGTKAKGLVQAAALRFTDKLHGTALMWRKTSQTELWAMSTRDGGRSWEASTIPVKFGGIFLARDGKTLTISSINGEISVWRN